MCKELCGNVYDDYRSGKLTFTQFKEYHTDQVIKAMRESLANGGTIVAFFDGRDGTLEVVEGQVAPLPQEDKPSE